MDLIRSAVMRGNADMAAAALRDATVRSVTRISDDLQVVRVPA